MSQGNSQGIHQLFNILCPLRRFFRVVESLPRDWFTNCYLKCFIFVLEHLVAQIEHCYIKFQTQHFIYIGQTIEKRRVFSFKMYGYNIALGLHAFCYKGFFPIEVANNPFVFTRAYSCRKHHNVIVALKSVCNLLGEITGLLACFVYRHPKGGYIGDIH